MFSGIRDRNLDGYFFSKIYWKKSTTAVFTAAVLWMYNVYLTTTID